MVRSFEYKDPGRLEVIKSLEKAGKKNDTPLWKRVSEELSKSNGQRAQVNIEKINDLTKSGDIVVVPGKTLGNGDISHAVTVASYKFSASATEKLKQAKGKAISIEELVKSNPKAKGVKLIK